METMALAFSINIAGGMTSISHPLAIYLKLMKMQ